MIRSIAPQRILHVDLTRGRIWTDTVAVEDVVKYLGREP